MKSQSRGGRPSSESLPERPGQDDVEREYGETDRKGKSAIGGSGQSGDADSFGSSRGDGDIDRDLEEVEKEDPSLLAGGRHDVESESQNSSGKSASGSRSKSR